MRRLVNRSSCRTSTTSQARRSRSITRSMRRREWRHATNRARTSPAGSAADAMTGRRGAAAAALVLCICFGTPVHAQSRLDLVRKRGALVCGVTPGIRGFADVDDRGHYSGLDVDICRALAAAIFGTGDKVRFVAAGTVDAFLKSNDVDL